jgi:hypothetical protein
MYKISCGSSVTHTGPHGDVLPHRSPCVHERSSIQRNSPLTNQEQAHIFEGPKPRDNWLKTPHAPHTHLGATCRKGDARGATRGLVDPRSRPTPFCVPSSALPRVIFSWWLKGSARCFPKYSLGILPESSVSCKIQLCPTQHHVSPPYWWCLW